MPTQTTGAELKRFYREQSFWPEQGRDYTYHEDEIVIVDGKQLSGGSPGGIGASTITRW